MLDEDYTTQVTSCKHDYRFDQYRRAMWYFGQNGRFLLQGGGFTT